MWFELGDEGERLPACRAEALKPAGDVTTGLSDRFAAAGAASAALRDLGIGEHHRRRVRNRDVGNGDEARAELTA